MSKNFSNSERHILNLLRSDLQFTYNGQDFTILESDKPTCRSGEPKTDIYVSAETDKHHREEFKISFKQSNADFLENKINHERAEQLFGSEWMKIISDAITPLKNNFSTKSLIYKSKHGRTEAGSITLGWKFELLNVLSGKLSGNMNLSRKQLIDVYAGSNLSYDKKNSTVNGKIIPNSGVANYMLFEDVSINTTQSVFDNLVPITKYVDQHPNIYFACKALNYRTFSQKYDGDRPLAVYVDWSIDNDKLCHRLCFDQPLLVGGNDACKKLLSALTQLRVLSTEGLNQSNVFTPEIIRE